MFALPVGDTWTGYDNFYYLFSHEDSRDAFAIPHDLKILKEVFTLEPGGYNAKNAFWESYSLKKLADLLPEADRDVTIKRIEELASRYDEMSAVYQSSKLTTLSH